MQSATSRVVSGNSGSMPSEAKGVTADDRQMIKLASKVSDVKAVGEGGAEIAKDATKTGVRVGAIAAQGFGESAETAGIVLGQPEIVAMGNKIASVGKAGNMVMDGIEGNLDMGDVAYEAGKQVIFGGMAKGANNAVKDGILSKAANNVFQAINHAWEKTTDWAKDLISN
jgi:hypothetical protein